MSIQVFDNVYFITFLFMILALFAFVAVFSVVGILRMDTTTFSKCPNCSVRIAKDVIICKSCGVNLNSIDNSSSGNRPTPLRRFTDYLNNMHPSQVNNWVRLIFFIFILILVSLSFYKA